MATLLRSLLFSLPLLSTLLPQAHSAEPTTFTAPKFTAAQSCQSASCHGGGVGKDQSVIWEKKDVHSRAFATLSTTRSDRMGEALKIPDQTKSARCIVCHSPLTAVMPDQFVKGARPDKAVSCESCHGPAEPWLRFHTRPDVTHEQRVSAGLRELEDLYGRANTCVACHLNIDSGLVTAGGHPELIFELDGQMNSEPPHYKDKGTWIGPRAWLTGQAVALRELSWKLSKTREDDLVPRWKALAWLLRRTEFATPNLSETGDFSNVQFAADRLARSAARSVWSKEKTAKQLRDYVTLSTAFRDVNTDPADQRRRGEVLLPAIDLVALGDHCDVVSRVV
ncbi:MAG: multiheme c-type cytochrome, partial [Verrucomicrobiota bacterium]